MSNDSADLTIRSVEGSFAVTLDGRDFSGQLTNVGIKVNLGIGGEQLISYSKESDTLSFASKTLRRALPPNEIANRYWTFFSEGKVDEAYALTSQSYRASLSKESFAKQELWFKGSSVSWSSTRINGAKAEVDGIISKPNGPFSITLGLVKENGSWRVFERVEHNTNLGKSGGYTILTIPSN